MPFRASLALLGVLLFATPSPGQAGGAGRKSLKGIGPITVVVDVTPEAERDGLTALIPACGALQARPTEPEHSQGVRLIHFADGLLTVNVRDARLSELLEEIARQSGLALQGHRSLADPITVELRQRPLEEGLRVILDDQSYALEYSLERRDEDREIPRVPKGLAIFPKREHSDAQRGGVDHGGEAGLGDVSIDIPRLSGVLESSEDVGDREDAIDVLAESGRPEVVLPLIRFALMDRDEDVRLAAVEALATLGGQGAAEALEIPLRDEESGIREGAIDALAAIGTERAAQSLVIALQDEDADLRKQAIDALGEIGSPTALQILEYAWAGDTDESVRAAAEFWLEELRDQSR